MSSRKPNKESVWEEDRMDTPRPSGYMDSVRSRLRDAFSSVRGGYGSSPALSRGRMEEDLEAGGQESGEEDYMEEPVGRPKVGAAAPVRPRPRPLSAKPPKFDGVGVSWDEFIMQFETCASINGWEDLEMGQHLFVSLEGEARSFIVGLRLPRLDYRLLVGKLEGWFGSVNRKESFRSQLQGRRRHQGEAATSYASDIGCLVARAFPGYPEEVLRELTLKALLDGLPEGD